MEMGTKISIIIVSIIFVFLYILGIALCFGKGGILIAGYHYKPKTARALKYHRILMRYVGIFLLLISALLNVGIICAIFEKIVIGIIFIVISIILTILGVIYANTSKKIKQLLALELDDIVEDKHKDTVESVDTKPDADIIAETKNGENEYDRNE